MDPRYTVVPRELPPQTALAGELRRILRTTGPTGVHYNRLDQILVNVQRRDYPRLISMYRYYPGGGRAFLADLEHFVGRMPLHPGEDAVRTRQGYLDRWTSRLYDAGIREIQLRFHSPRPISASPENLARWRSTWRQYFQSDEGSTHSCAPIALWVLHNWNHITSQGDQVALMHRLGWVVQTSGNQDYQGSYSILSANPTAHEAGMSAGLSFFGGLAGRHDEMILQVVERAQAYHEAYVAWNYPLWRGRTKPFLGESAGLDQAISNLYQLNRQMQLPNQEAQDRINALHRLLTEIWQLGNFPPEDLVEAAGINTSGGVV